MKFLNGLLGRAPFAILGAIGIFSIVGVFVTLEENFYLTLEAWRVVTRSIWDFLFGWLFELIGWEVPWWAKDYLTMGLIVGGAEVRRTIYLWRRRPKELNPVFGYEEPYLREVLTIIGLNLTLWPMTIVRTPLEQKRTADAFLPEDDELFGFPRTENLNENQKIINLRDEMVGDQESANLVYIETFVWFVVILGFNYAFVFSGANTVEPIVQIWT